MPDLNLSDDRKQYQDLARDFAQNEIAPKSAELDHRAEFPLQILKKAWGIGLFNVRVPESLGGLGLGALDGCVIAEEIGAACAGVGSAFFGNDLAVTPVLVAATEEQQQILLAPSMESFALASYAFDAGQVTGTKTDTGLKLNGSADALNPNHASWILVTANSSDGKQTLVAVDISSPGITVGKALPAVGLKAANLATITFKDVRVPADRIIGAFGEGAKVIATSKIQLLPMLGSYAIGITKSAMQHSVRYSTERHTFGQPIANHQAVSFLLADMAKDIEAARFLCRKAAWLSDENHADAQLSHMAHIFACDSATKATIDAVQVFGGYGYSREYPVEKLMRDAKMLQVYGYDSDTTRVNIGRELVAASTGTL